MKGMTDGDSMNAKYLVLVYSLYKAQMVGPYYYISTECLPTCFTITETVQTTGTPY